MAAAAAAAASAGYRVVGSAPGALGKWFHEIRSDENGIFVTYRKGSQRGDEFGRPWREDGDKDQRIHVQHPRGFGRAGLAREASCLA